jgi:hypothetical protein
MESTSGTYVSWTAGLLEEEEEEEEGGGGGGGGGRRRVEFEERFSRQAAQASLVITVFESVIVLSA